MKDKLGFRARLTKSKKNVHFVLLPLNTSSIFNQKNAPKTSAPAVLLHSSCFQQHFTSRRTPDWYKILLSPFYIQVLTLNKAPNVLFFLF